jgi:hypothetical protein
MEFLFEYEVMGLGLVWEDAWDWIKGYWMEWTPTLGNSLDIKERVQNMKKKYPTYLYYVLKISIDKK